MSALFDFNAFLIVVLLTICTCTYVKTRAPRILSVKTGWALPFAAAPDAAAHASLQFSVLCTML